MDKVCKVIVFSFLLYLSSYLLLTLNGQYVRSGTFGYVWEPYAIEWHSTLKEDGWSTRSHWSLSGFFYFPLLYHDRLMWHRDRRWLFYHVN